MASSGREKWRKYFHGKTEVVTKTKGISAVYDTIDGRETKYHLADGTPITVIPCSEWNGRYRIKDHGWLSDNSVAKPLKRNNSLASINSLAFASLGDDVVINWGGTEVPCKRFTSLSTLNESIRLGLPEYIRESLDSKEIDDNERDTLGCYLGEVLIGVHALSGGNGPWVWHPTAFYLPTDTSFSGVDSFVETANGLTPLSSKYGAGAAASFFSNILIGGMDIELEESIFSRVVEAAKDRGVTASDLFKKQKSKHVLYQYGVRRILGMTIDDPYGVYEAVKNGELTEDRYRVSREIRLLGDTVDPRILEYLDSSMTAFFSRATAEALNSCSKSMEQMKRILIKKDYWQVNLDKNAWRKGVTKFTYVNSGEAKLQIIGSKAAMNDITGSQGMINYRLSY